jgi:DNA polymerase
MLYEVLSGVGIAREEVYVTNVVKHFNWVPDQRGKRRIHSEIAACRPWLDAELQVIKPEVLVCLGATAAQSLGKDFSVNRRRGELVDSPLAPYVIATVHPSSILRAVDDESRRRQKEAFAQDLAKVSQLLRHT